jgi:hypothetical protein
VKQSFVSKRTAAPGSTFDDRLLRTERPHDAVAPDDLGCLGDRHL